MVLSGILIKGVRSVCPAIQTVLGIDFETANGSRTSACSVGLALFDYCTGELLEKKHQLLNPHEDFSYYNVMVHSITAEAVSDSPTFSDFFPEMYNLINQASIVVAHNATFDISVFTRCAEKAGLSFSPFDFFCTLAMSRQILPELDNHKLNTVVYALQLGSFSHHRADDDAEMCGRVFIKLAKMLDASSIDDVAKYASIRIGRAYAYGYDGCSKISTSRKKIIHLPVYDLPSAPVSNKFAGKTFVFTGTLISMPREEAQNAVVMRGGIISNSVSKKTDYLICGIQDLRATKGNPKSSKQLKAEALIEKGVPIAIISEEAYLKLLNSASADQ